MDEFTRRLLPPIAGGSDADTLTTEPDAPEAPGDPPTDTPAAEPGTEPAPETTTPPAVESFIPPDQLPEEIKPHWKRMHRAYTKALDGIKASKADLDFLTQYRSDPAVARQVIQAEAQRLGLQLAPANGTTPAQPTTPAAAHEAPAALVARIAERMDPSLAWMAKDMAAAAWTAAQEANRPLVEKDRAKEVAARESEWGALSSKLTETAPGWEAHESDMNALWDWLKSPALSHPQFGDKLTFLYNAVTGGSAAKAQAIRAMGDAARNRTSTGLPTRSTVSNISERVLKAKTPRDAMKAAAEEAEREMRALGMTVPD